MFNDRTSIIHWLKKSIGPTDFLNSPFSLKLILRLIAALKIGYSIVE